MIVAPGSTIGIIGGGQLGRMLSIAAARLGYRSHVFAPDEAPCGADVAHRFTRAAYHDEGALAEFGAQCDVVTYEFENLPVGPLGVLGDKLRPGTRSLTIAQDRAVEKDFLTRAGARIADWAEVDDQASLDAAVAALGVPLLLKTRRLGYDGKGQAWIHRPEDATAAYASIGCQPAVAEKGVHFSAEFSVLVGRKAAGGGAVWPVPRNIHKDGILRRSELPAGAPIDAQAAGAVRMATALADTLGHVGVLAVEFFATDDGPLVNEIAPRVHNSGHWTIEGSVTSQFEQHIRAICGLPLGDTRMIGTNVAMDNLLGDEVGEWHTLLADPSAHLHLYGKGAPRPGRKMGHVTRVA